MARSAKKSSVVRKTKRRAGPASSKKSAEPKRKIVVVLGMHRSGSSAIARGLTALGVDLGDNLMPPIEGNNEKGFWEDLDIYHFNERLLEKAGSAWHKLARLDKDTFIGPAFSEERREALVLLSAKLQDKPLFGFKDPRTAVLLPFWQCIFEDLDLDDRYLIAVRNPLESAASLNARDGFPVAKGVFLWAKHTLEAVRCTIGKPRVFVSYNQILTDPADELQRIAMALDLPPPDVESEAIKEYHDEFITRNLRHNITGAKELQRSGLASGLVIELNTIVTEWAHAQAGETLSIEPDLWRSLEMRFDESAPLLDYADIIEDGRLRAESQSQSAGVKLHETESALSQAVAEKQAALEARQQIKAEFEQTHLELEELRRSNAAELGLLTEAKQRAEGELQKIEQALQKVETEGAERHATDEKTIQQLSAEREQFAARIEALENALEAAREKAAAEIAELKTRQEQDEEAIRLLMDERAQLEARNEELRRAQEETVENATIEANGIKTQAEIEIAKLILQTGAEIAEVKAANMAAIEALQTETDTALNTLRREMPHSAKTAGEAIDALLREHREMRVQIKASESEKRQLASTAAERARDIDRLKTAKQTLKVEKREQFKDLLLSRAEINEIRRSTSWRLTAPLRAAGRIARDPIGGTRKVAGKLARAAWRLLPMPAQSRGRFASRLFAVAPLLFFWSSSYKAWKAEQSCGHAYDAPAAMEAPFEPPADPSLEGYVSLSAKTPPAVVSTRAIAFYLPQFHLIAENDAWWGQGFTEWTKVKPAKPLFEGHYQPHEPGELGYYNLLDDENVMERQAELAKLYGISGFCFYFYWFAGKRLLETPLQKFLSKSEIDFPFCLCWANENWSRRWDGRHEDILIAQDHSPGDDIAFISYASVYLRDARYIRIDGRPLLIVYRPASLPSARQTAERWRRWCRENGIGEIYLAYTQSFETAPPSDYGFDAAIEFPPNNMGLAHEPSLVSALPENSAVSIYDWRKVAGRSRHYPMPDYKLFRTVNPSWDNTPRRPDDGAILVNASPSTYKAWLENAVRDTNARFKNSDERLIFINAWNEWAEGAHLEPDKKYGYAWLEATRRVLDSPAQAGKKKILIVTHDLHRHGAQYLALNILKTLRQRFGFEVASISGEAGELAAEFQKEGPLAILDPAKITNAEIDSAIAEFAAQGYHSAILNSAASGWIAPHLAKHGVEQIGLVNELPSIIRSMNLEDNLRAFDRHARATVFPATIVRDKDAKAVGLNGWRHAQILPQGVYKAGGAGDLAEKREARANIAVRLGLPQDARIVLGVGYADHRKGVDIFLEWAMAAARRWPDLHFVWLGKIDRQMQPVCDRLLGRAGSRAGNIHFPGFVEDTGEFYQAASLYVLTSREDPFPSTALEALSAGTPVIMVRGTGGIEDLAVHGCVKAIATAGPAAFVDAAAAWLDDEAALSAAAVRGRDLMREKFGFTSYVGALADLLGLQPPDISVVVPNYNYARYLEQRLGSILAQTLSPREIIFLEDASSDDSIAVAERVLRAAPVNWRIIRNETNAGDVFAQWRKGVEAAKGELVWIAEADDWADPRFLETAARAFAREEVVLSFTQSNQAAEGGHVTSNDYQDYVRDVSPDRWTRSFVNDGLAEIREGLSVKNTIPNVSAVLFRRAALAQVLTAHAQDIASYRVAGDWCVYVNLLRKGAAAFDPVPLNYHRRHDESVTISRFDLAELAEIARMQAYVARDFSPPEDYARKARAYLENLAAHFNLARRHSAAEIGAAMNGQSPLR